MISVFWTGDFLNLGNWKVLPKIFFHKYTYVPVVRIYLQEITGWCCSCKSFNNVSIGSDGPGSSITEERANEEGGTSTVYNPHASLSITLQRQRLPIFKVNLEIGVLN